MKTLLKDLGQVSAIIGAQWGDEGKGKMTDILGSHFDILARACGGANAGHTIVVGGKKHVFRLLPSGCLHEGKPVVLGSGMVIHLPTLLEEIEILKVAGITILDRLLISPAAHIVFDFHKEIDGVLEERRTKGIGTTKRGIGPAYMDKAARTGVRMERLNDDLSAELTSRAKDVKAMYGVTVNMEQETKNLAEARRFLLPCVVPSLPELMQHFLEEKKTVLIEGAQATLLDLDHGTYPYVTSSFTTSAGALQGLGMPPKSLASCIGVIKAYCTRVGAGDFLTEDPGEIGDRLRERGGEYGSITGRPRRCGWLHLPDVMYAAFVNGFSCFNLTKLDVLDEEAEIPVGIRKDPTGAVEYRSMKGWKTSTKGIREWKELPKEAREYVEFIETFTNVPVRLIGTGQAREDIIVR
ncbi:MAG: adenylosuccinate synthase [Candidatus Peribacteraceae bacterium]|nr:adenylosuccinate synthase [Candidatus Peribacteraceae bacterium]